MRTTHYSKLHKQFLDRWSPRDFSDESISHEDLMTMFEAAHWAPSSFNEQPWRFVYAQKPDDLERFQGLLGEGNSWAKSTPVLVILFAKRNFSLNDKPNRTALFDAGSAWMSLALQARELGLFTHAMVGYNDVESYRVAGVNPVEYESMCMIAVGKRNQNDEQKEIPNDRKPLDKIVFEGKFTG